MKNPTPARQFKGNVTGFDRFAYAAAMSVVKAVSKPRWSGTENLPKEGPFIVAPNHMSEFDPVSMGCYLGYNGFQPRFLAKDSLFEVPVVGSFMKWWGMIPVVRDTSTAGDALAHARTALDDGEIVVIYFEGTLTRDPALWPMKGKTGLARLALDSRVPVIPVVQWGAQDIMDRYSRLKLRIPRPELHIRALPALDYSDIPEDSRNHEGVRVLTARLEQTLLAGSGKLRGEEPPKVPWDMKLMDGPGKRQLKSFSGWRGELSKHSPNRQVLPTEN